MSFLPSSISVSATCNPIAYDVDVVLVLALASLHLRLSFFRIVQLVARLTKDIIETYQICNPQFNYSEDLNPKRYLTSPSTGVLNDGYDNANSDLILTVNYVLINLDTQRRFVIASLL